MGQTQSLSTEIEIQASPATVRSVFLDFPQYKQWSTWTIEPIGTDKKPSELNTEDRVKVDMKGTVFRPLMMENSTDTFAWEGSLYGLLVGKHEFHFSPSKKNPGGTTMIQIENFRGLLAFMFAPGWSGRESTLKNWNEFFADLKKEVEKSSS